ncbi:hypothetical protein TNCT_681071 [Trichonephila clavata]|uniref:Uncharacterized protein n=1 Tax=Trichonephila clavata TaxID=2740835 RepID=A0A8X6LU58_TRICU|nr:hypothetical protein TNCT_681071 [Trichonephila clavata]
MSLIVLYPTTSGEAKTALRFSASQNMRTNRYKVFCDTLGSVLYPTTSGEAKTALRFSASQNMRTVGDCSREMISCFLSFHRIDIKISVTLLDSVLYPTTSGEAKTASRSSASQNMRTVVLYPTTSGEAKTASRFSASQNMRTVVLYPTTSGEAKTALRSSASQNMRTVGDCSREMISGFLSFHIIDIKFSVTLLDTVLYNTTSGEAKTALRFSASQNMRTVVLYPTTSGEAKTALRFSASQNMRTVGDCTREMISGFLSFHRIDIRFPVIYLDSVQYPTTSGEAKPALRFSASQNMRTVVQYPTTSGEAKPALRFSASQNMRTVVLYPTTSGEAKTALRVSASQNIRTVVLYPTTSGEAKTALRFSSSQNMRTVVLYPTTSGEAKTALRFSASQNMRTVGDCSREMISGFPSFHIIDIKFFCDTLGYSSV